jgi:hypothetical protein
VSSRIPPLKLISSVSSDELLSIAARLGTSESLIV